MDLFRTMLGGASGSGDSSSSSGGRSSAETIERLVERLTNATLLEDRRDACRALRAMSRKFRVEVGAQALDLMLEVLENDRQDEEIVGYALDCLCNICSPDEFEEEVVDGRGNDPVGTVGEQFTEIYLKRPHNVQVAVDLLEEFDFRVRRPAVRLLTHLLLNKPREMQEMILSSQLGVSRLMDVLVDTREVLRNDTLLLLIQLTKGNANLQKIVAFENCFDKLADIIETEGHTDGGIVVEDCLRLMLNLLRNNSSNQTFFREGSYIQRMAPYFELTLDEEEVEVGWSAQKVANMMNMLLVVRTLVSPSNPAAVATSCQSTVLSCGLLEKLCSILLASGIPAEILTETIITIAEAMRGHLPSQEFFARVTAPSVPPRPALILLLMSMVNEKQPFSLRCAVLYCFQCHMYKNPAGQSSVMGTLLPDNQPKPPSSPSAADPEMTAGQLLCGGLFAADRLSNWFSAVALAHGLANQEGLKAELLRVQLSTASGNEPVSLLLQCCNILQHTPHIQTRLGLLMLVATWVEGCPLAVAQLLDGVASVVPFLTGQIGSNEHDELERLGQGLCAFLLGLCVIHNDDSVPKHSQSQLYQLIEKRIGFEVFMAKLSEVSKHEAYNKALKHPQIKSTESRDLIFDHTFCLAFKHLEHKVIIHLEQRRENKSGDDASQLDPTIVLQYKEVIREQDHKVQDLEARISDLTGANLYLQGELGTAKQQIEELNGSVQMLKDLNSVLRAQQAGTPSSKAQVVENGPVAGQKEAPVATAFSEKERTSLERELKIRDDIIQELEIRLSRIGSKKETPEKVNGTDDDSHRQPTLAELEMLQSQIQALQQALSKKEADLDHAESTLAEVRKSHQAEVGIMRKEEENRKTEQEDLMLLLADQDQKLEQYRKKLQELGEPPDRLGQ